MAFSIMKFRRGYAVYPNRAAKSEGGWEVSWLVCLQETALFEVGYRHNGLFDRNPLVRVSVLPYRLQVIEFSFRH